VRLALVLFASSIVWAQTEPAQPSQPAATGLEPSWNIAVVVEEIGKHATRMLALTEQLDATGWERRGASGTYTAQLESSRQQMHAVEVEAAALTRNPERLSAALQLFFRLESVHAMVRTLEEATRRYQSEKLAQSLAALEGEGGANFERLRAYIVNLAQERETQFEVMDREAQRCRATLMAPAPPKSPGRKK
jgi:hypothetical protein